MFVGHVEQSVEQAAVAPVDPRTLDESLAYVGLVRLETANQERPGEIVEVAVDRVVREAEALCQARGIPGLAVNRCKHAEQSVRRLGFGGQAPGWQVALGQKRQIVKVPSWIPFGIQHATVGVAPAQPEAFT